MPSVTDQVKADLPNFPSDIIVQWMGYYAESDGWPPTGRRWETLLGGRPLTYWRSIYWAEQQLSADIAFEFETENRVAEIVRANLYNEDNAYRRFFEPEEAKRRMAQLLAYLKAHGTVPCAPILLSHDNRYEILDGNHRFAAFRIWRQVLDRPLHKGVAVPMRPLHTCWVGVCSA